MIGKSAPLELSICRLGVLPPGFYIRSKGEHGLILYENAEVLSVVRATQEKRLRVCVCLIHAARHLARRNDIRRRSVEARRDNRGLQAARLFDEWIEEQQRYDRAVDLAYGRLPEPTRPKANEWRTTS